VGKPHAVADQDDRPLGVRQQPQRLFDGGAEVGRRGSLSRRRERRQGFRIDGRSLHVERDVDPDRARPAGQGDMHRLFEVAADVGRVHHRLGELGQGRHHRDDVDLLQAHLAHAAVALEVGALGLAGDEQAGRGVEPRAGQAGDGVGPARPGGEEGATQAAAHLGVGFRRHGAGLLVQVRHALDAGMVEEGIVEVHGPAAGHHEHVADVLSGYELGDVVRQFQASLRALRDLGKGSPSADGVAKKP
jgi:hypothetical protein